MFYKDVYGLNEEDTIGDYTERNIMDIAVTQLNIEALR